MAYVFRAKCKLTWSLLTNQTFAMTFAAVQFNFQLLSRQILSTEFLVVDTDRITCLLSITDNHISISLMKFRTSNKNIFGPRFSERKKQPKFGQCLSTVGQNNTCSYFWSMLTYLNSACEQASTRGTSLECRDRAVSCSQRNAITLGKIREFGKRVLYPECCYLLLVK